MPSKTTTVTPLTLAQYKALVAGIPIYCSTAVITVDGQTFTAPQAVAYIQTVLNAVAAVESAKTALADARAAEEQLLLREGTTVKAIRANIAAMFTSNTTALAALDIAPKKARVPLSAEARIAATAKLRATRLARGITSKKEKAKVSGNVTGVTITPVTSSASEPAPAGTSTPIPATASAPGMTSAAVATPAVPAVPIVPSTAVPSTGVSAAPANGAATHT